MSPTKLRHVPFLAALGLLALVLAPAGAAGGDKCYGTKKERKQTLEERLLNDAELAKLVEAFWQSVAAERLGMRDAALARLEKEYAAHQATGAPFTYDMLIISGGGSKGAFGAGILQGWGAVPPGPDARPEFDIVTGVSTGALIAPFAFIGTDAAFATVADLYANPEDNWARKRGWIKFLPGHVSLYKTCHLRDAIWDALDPAMLGSLAAGARDHRLLVVGTTNLDLACGRSFDLSRIATGPDAGVARDEIVRRLVASSAIPGAFPPVEIDGMYYADGGATSNLFVVTFPGPEGPVAQFRARHPEAPAPRVRAWIIVNQQVRPDHAVTPPKWINVTTRALDTLTSTSQVFALNLIRDMAWRARNDAGIDVEVRLISIPEGGPEPTTKDLFEKAYMNALLELGRTLGRDPSSWSTQIPSPLVIEDRAAKH